MDNIETALSALLAGNDIKQLNDLCDFTLEDQNEVAGEWPFYCYSLLRGQCQLFNLFAFYSC